MLAERAGVALPSSEYSKEAREKEKLRTELLEINKLAAKYYYYLLRQEEGKRAYHYLNGRGLSDETITKFGLGYSDQHRNNLYRYLKSKGYEDEILRESGLFTVNERYGMADKFWNRVIFPIMDVNSRVIGFGGRVMGEGTPKYLNSPETKIFDKGRNLYGLNTARLSRKKELILCEGYMDVIAMHQAGFTNSVASLGTALTSGHASLLKRYTQEVLLLYDSDEAGVRAALRAIPILREAGITARVVNLSPCKDPDEFISNRGKEAFEERLDHAEDSFLFRVHKAQDESSMESPQEQNLFFDKAAAMLLELSDELERNLYIEAIVKEYAYMGITQDNLRRRVQNMAMKGLPAQHRERPKTTEKPHKKESAGETSQKLLLTWLITYPGIFPEVEKHIKPEDFVNPLYSRVASMVYDQLREGKVDPARILGEFPDEDEHRETASLFNAVIPLETEEERNKAFGDALYRVKAESCDKKSREIASDDMSGLQAYIKAKKELEELGNNRQKIHVSFENEPMEG